VSKALSHSKILYVWKKQKKVFPFYFFNLSVVRNRVRNILFAIPIIISMSWWYSTKHSSSTQQRPFAVSALRHITKGDQMREREHYNHYYNTTASYTHDFFHSLNLSNMTRDSGKNSNVIISCSMHSMLASHGMAYYFFLQGNTYI